MFNVGDIVKYKIQYHRGEIWGMIIGILEMKDCLEEPLKGVTLFRIKPLFNSELAHSDVTKDDILEVYSKTYDKLKKI